MCAVLPVPAVAYEYMPGLAFARAMNSSIVVALIEGFATRSCGRYPASATATKVALRLVAGRLHEVRRHDHLRRVPQKDGVAVGRRARDRLRADHAAAAGLVLHDDRNAEILAELLADDARDHVARAARPVGNDELDRTRGVRLRLDVLDRGDDGEQRGQGCEQPELHDRLDRVMRRA